MRLTLGVLGAALLASGFALTACRDTEETQLAVGTGTATATASTSPSPANSSTSSTATPTPLAGLTPAPTLTPGPGETKYRWGNVTLLAPADGVVVDRYIGSPEENPPDGGLLIAVRGDQAAAIIDADDGRIVRRTDATNAGIERALSTIRVGDPLSYPLPWPLGTTEPTRQKAQLFSLRFWEPDPDSGINRFNECGVGPNDTPPAQAAESGSGCSVGITNGRSIIFATGDAGTEVQGKLAPEDADAFQRWFGAVELVKP